MPSAGRSMRSLTPSNDAAPPKRPLVQVVPTVVAVWLLPDQSAASVPEVSSSAYATRRPAGETPVLETVTATELDVRVFPFVSRAIAVSVCEPFSSARVSQGTGVGRRDVLGADVHAVDSELDSCHGRVVGRIRADGRDAGHRRTTCAAP